MQEVARFNRGDRRKALGVVVQRGMIYNLELKESYTLVEK